MIHGRDWIVFLENGIPLEELPLSEDHYTYCCKWLQDHNKEAAKIEDFQTFNAEEFREMLHHAIYEVVESLH